MMHTTRIQFRVRV